MSLPACFKSAPNSNVASPTIRLEQLTNGIASSPASSVPASFEGYLDIANCDAVTAWGWDTTRPNEPLKLNVYDSNLLVATVTADGFRQDLLAVGKGNGKHMMSWPIPVEMKDGKKHVITVKFDETKVELGGAHKEITCHP